MAQSEAIEVKLLVDADVTRIRKKAKSIIRDAEQLNRELAQLQERLGGLGARLQEFGIDLVIGDD